MMKPKKRLVKAKLKEDRFVLLTAQAESWFEEHRNEVLYGLAGLIVVVAIGFAISWSKATSESNAAFDELLARDAYSRSDLDSALIRSDAILEDYPGTNAAATALIIQGRVHEARGELDQAAEAFEKVLDDYSDQEYLGFAAAYALGTIALGRNDYGKAAEYYEKAAAKYPKHFSAPVSLLAAGQALEKVGKLNQAKALYRKVLSDYSKSRSADAARDNLAKLEFMP